MPRPDGRGSFKLAPNAKIIVVGNCSYCKKPVPECRCGRPKLYEGR